MLDAATHDRIHTPQRDVAQPSSAPTPSGCRPAVTPAWYVVATYPKAERRAHAALHLKGYASYLPLCTVRLPNRHYRIGPMFPGYLFIHLDLRHPWYPIQYAPGVYRLLNVDGVPTLCPPGAVEAVQRAEALATTQPHASTPWAPGTPVAVSRRAFERVPAVVLSVSNDTALVAFVILGQLREVSVPLDCLTARED